MKFGDSTHISGLVLKEKFSHVKPTDGALKHAGKIVSSYFNSPYSSEKITLELNGEKINLNTNEKGEFEYKTNKEVEEPVVFFHPDGSQIETIQLYPTTYNFDPDKYLLVSDIDDTILISKSVRPLSKLLLMLLRPVIKRKVVEESMRAYIELEKKGVQFIYVSGSENNLFHLLSSFFSFRKVPTGPLFLRSFVRWNELFKSKNVKGFKVRNISDIVKAYQGNKLILFGDDSQHDIDVFRIITEKFPKRVHSIFLRKTGFNKAFKDYDQGFSEEATAVNIIYYEHFEEIEEYIKRI